MTGFTFASVASTSGLPPGPPGPGAPAITMTPGEFALSGRVLGAISLVCVGVAVFGVF
jgi:hypothetical protein